MRQRIRTNFDEKYDEDGKEAGSKETEANGRGPESDDPTGNMHESSKAVKSESKKGQNKSKKSKPAWSLTEDAAQVRRVSV